jgi:hypothetical protein
LSSSIADRGCFFDDDVCADDEESDELTLFALLATNGVAAAVLADAAS